MSGFNALNIESDDESDIEIDDTKEIQIEEALKLYQNALKLHAEGPPSLDQAAAAYQELFASEVFHYPESQTELRRLELYGPPPELDDVLDDQLLDPVTAVATNAEGGPSTLPQILHLSHKNYAQFKLEVLQHTLKHQTVSLSDFVVHEASTALDHFVEALDKDDTDLDLWRRTASVGTILNSKRVARFCLEAVLDGDDDGLSSMLSLPGLEESLAAQQLHTLVAQIQDTLSLVQTPLSTFKRRQLSRFLKQRLDLYDDIESHQSSLPKPVKTHQPQRIVLKAPRTWTELGDVLLRQLVDHMNGHGWAIPGSAVSFDMRDYQEVPIIAGISANPELAVTQSQEPTRPVFALPSTIDEQFPGLDKGKPTVLVPSMEYSEHGGPGPRRETFGDVDMELPTITLPTRKRSTSAAGLNGDEGRTKSKRIRARESVAEAPGTVDANIRWEYEQQLNELQAADDWVFDTIGSFLERVGVNGFAAVKDVRSRLESDLHSPSEAQPLYTAEKVFYAFLNNFSDDLAPLLLVGGDSLELSSNPSYATYGVSCSSSTTKNSMKPAFNDNSYLTSTLHTTNDGWKHVRVVSYEWLMRLLVPGMGGQGVSKAESSYTGHLWPEPLKTLVVRILVNLDDYICHAMSSWLEHLDELILRHEEIGDEKQRKLAENVAACQTIFELHLDIYCLIKQPNSGVGIETVTIQGDRLNRWADIARDTIQLRSTVTAGDPSLKDELNLRFLWAITLHVSVSQDVEQQHVVEMMQELRNIFRASGDPVIELQNNAVMPEISVAALDREISRRKTREFFLKVTDQDQKDPVTVIESLEPLLNALEATQGTASSSSDSIADEARDVRENENLPLAVSPELVNFLRNSNISIRLLLWQRLREAYQAIEYKPMELVCCFRTIKTVLEELQSTAFLEAPQRERQVTLLKSLRLLKETTLQALVVVQTSADALDCMIEANLMPALAALGTVLHLLQAFNVFEDLLRVGQKQQPTLDNGLPVPSFAAVTNTVHDLQLHVWILHYHLFKDAMSQNTDLFTTPAEDKFDYLRTLHRNLGIRGVCGGSNKAFIRLLKDEFSSMTTVDGYDTEMAQVLYDMYGLNCFLNPGFDRIEHKCTHDAFLDRGVAMQAVDLLLGQASKISIKDLTKHPLKDTIEKVHGAVVRRKPTDTILRNREVYRAFLKSPINPVDLYQCLEGAGNEVIALPVPIEQALLASKGWYFLMGHIALSKYRSQKRTVPTPTEDVDIAIAFFMHDLEYSLDNWETWFRLAQAYDTKVEESVVWSAEKLNNNMPEVTQLQRAAIHCYTMATALAQRSADLAFDTSSKMSDLYTDFANRIYSSSRPPFSMLPFALHDTEKFLSKPTGMAKDKPFKELRLYTAWKFTKVLLQRAITGNSNQWQLHFMLGKCLWQMYAASHELQRHDRRPSAGEVLDAFTRALELLPGKRDSRDTKREPLLEPHYKLVSIVHKLVTRGGITLEEAREALSATPYARTAAFPSEIDDWTEHILLVLKNLRAADKSNWHHRMVARAAQIVYDENNARNEFGGGASLNIGARGAKHELTQQMFTKTMVLQVWRPEGERAGRHFVYTTQYTRFFVRILEQLRDRNGMDQLARRVRRRPNEFFEHIQVWQEICSAYLRLLREYGSLAEGLETSTFSSIAYDDFQARRLPLEKWMQEQPSGKSPGLDVLRDVQELKKINSSYMKPGPIDDLIGDAYAYLFSTIGKQLWEEERRANEIEEAQKPPPPVQSPVRNPMMSLNHLMNLDGANDGPPAAGPSINPTMLPSQFQAIPPQPEPATAPRRKIGVGRREVRTCAESCHQKASAASRSIAPENARVHGLILESSKDNHSGEASAETSAPGSIHDSADDESDGSELSELEEVVDDEEEASTDHAAPRPLFPGLATTDSPAASGAETEWHDADDGTAVENATAAEDGTGAEVVEMNCDPN